MTGPQYDNLTLIKRISVCLLSRKFLVLAVPEEAAFSNVEAERSVEKAASSNTGGQAISLFLTGPF